MEPFEEAKWLAINYIDYAPRTRLEVQRRLAKAEYDEEMIAAVLEELERIGLLNDSQFSQAWVENRSRSKKLGRVRLASELRQKGVSKETVDEAVADIQPEDEFEAALALAEKRLKPSERDDPGAKRRLAGYLQRRGYNWATIEQVFSRMFANTE
jgi:regulatory protein